MMDSSPSLFRTWAERFLGIQTLRRLHESLRHNLDLTDFLNEILASLNVEFEFSEKDLDRITSSGPTVVVSNHPFGGIEGILLARFLLMVRKDVRLFANPILKQIPEMTDLFFFVEPYSTSQARRQNFRATKEALDWVAGGGMLGMFPSGTVSHITWRNWRVKDPKWNTNVVRLVRKTQATVVPIFFEGRNSLFFQLAGLIHPKLRTLLLPLELLRCRNRTIKAVVGSPIAHRTLPEESNDEEIAAYFRFRTYMLRNRKEKKETKRKLPRVPKIFKQHRPERIASHRGTERLSLEVARLPIEQKLVDSKEYDVYYAEAKQAPDLLHEIGRLREKTFRREGEGTGRALDLDPFDEHYLHLFIWNRERKELVGAYRVGRTDEILKRQGMTGIYTSHLFKYRKDFVSRITPGLELGRSFVRPRYQKSYLPLMLLWKGIGAFVHRHPRYRYLFGPVSISGSYSPLSRALVVDYMTQKKFDAVLASLVRARRPPKKKRFGGPSRQLQQFEPFIREVEDLSNLISDVETHYQGLPMLLKHYLKLGGKLLSFNVDRDFNNCLDGLILVDLLCGNQKTVQSYMGKEGYQAFVQYHSGPAPTPSTGEPLYS